jgi:DNA-binding XRE family transcriptional regulator
VSGVKHLRVGLAEPRRLLRGFINMGAVTRTAKRKRIHVDKRGYERPRAENARLRSELKKRPKLLEDRDPDLPPLPLADENGHYAAIETARVIIARQVIRGRKAAGWTQAELAARAGVRQETIARIETGEHAPGLKTMAKIDLALRRVGFDSASWRSQPVSEAVLGDETAPNTRH